jgi:hypothetical protein
VEIGGEILAKEMEPVCKGNAGGRTIILRLYQLKSDFVVVDRQNKSMQSGEYYPLHSARLNIGEHRFDAGRPYAFKDVLPHIRKRFTELPTTDRRRSGKEN